MSYYGSGAGRTGYMDDNGEFIDLGPRPATMETVDYCDECGHNHTGPCADDATVSTPPRRWRYCDTCRTGREATAAEHRAHLAWHADDCDGPARQAVIRAESGADVQHL